MHQISIILLHFNSQPHKEADLRAHLLSDWGQDISTHSLTRRLTFDESGVAIYPGHFNSQPHKEADDCFNGFSLQAITFQLTASQGG